jgi:flagellar hook protein FlgE
MGLTSAMYTGLSGLNSNQFSIDTIGNDVANVNTTAYKEHRANFENQFSLMLNAGTGPGAMTGGTNPSQVGLGSKLSGVQQNLLQGSIETTGVPTDLAIEGEGYFVVRTPETDQAFTRDGTMGIDSNHHLVTSDGHAVQGYGIDSNFNIVTSELDDLEIPLGILTTARQTTEAQMDGNLNAGGDIATQGTILHSQVLEEGPGAPVTGASLLTNVYDPTSPGAPMFADGDVISVSNALRGGRQLPTSTFTVDATSTMDDFTDFLAQALVLNDDPAAPGSPGITISAAAPPDAGTLIVEGNAGEDNALELGQTAITSTNSNFVPFAFTEAQEAVGESVHTSFMVYDSLGNDLQVNLTMALEQKTNAGVTWRFYAESPDDTDANKVLGTTGTVMFDSDGRLINTTNNTISIDRDNTGALDPVRVTLDFENVTGLNTETSTMVMTTQDGYAAGSLTNFAVQTDGVIMGSFSNGLTQPLGQVVLATFTNAEGLVKKTSNLYEVGPNSGQAVITAAETLGAGKIYGGALELSNVDLTREFIGLVTASTGFSASGRVISTSNDLLNELMLIAR